MDFWCDPDDDARRPCLSEEEVANDMCCAIPSEHRYHRRLERGYHRGLSTDTIRWLECGEGRQELNGISIIITVAPDPCH